MPPKLTPPYNEEGLIPLIRFPNQGKGALYGLTHAGIGGEDLPEGYHYAINMTVEADRFRPSYASAQRWGITGAAKGTELRGWYDSSNIPIALLLQDGRVKIIKNATITDETDDTTATYGSGAFWDTAAGTGRFIVGTTTGSKFLQKRTNDGTWTAGTVAGLLCTEAGGAFYATANDYQVKKWALGNDPTSAAAGSTIAVGDNTAKIKSIGAIGSVPVIGKEDGIWIFSEAETRFINDLRLEKNSDNCLFMRPDGQGGVLTATWDGSLIHINKYFQPEIFDPREGKTLDRDTPLGKIVDACYYQGSYYVLTDQAYRLTQQCGLRVFFYDASADTYTDFTTEAADQRTDTVITLGSMTPGDFLYIGADAKFPLIDITMGAVSSTNARPTLTFAASGDGIFSATIQYTNLFDGTNSTPTANPTPFGQSGAFAMTTSSNFASWAQTTQTGFTGTGIAKFWMRIGLAT